MFSNSLSSFKQIFSSPPHNSQVEDKTSTDPKTTSPAKSDLRQDPNNNATTSLDQRSVQLAKSVEKGADLETILRTTADFAVKSAKTPESFLRGKDASSYFQEMKSVLGSHLEITLNPVLAQNAQHAETESKQDPKLVGLTSSRLLEDTRARDAIVADYQTLIAAFLGSSPSSAREAARSLPKEAIAMTRYVKEALDQAVKDKELTLDQANRATRLLVINNVFLRGINSLISDVSTKLGVQALNRGLALSTLLQNQANEVKFGAKQTHLQPLNDVLASEQSKVSAFTDEVVAMLDERTGATEISDNNNSARVSWKKTVPQSSTLSPRNDFLNTTANLSRSSADRATSDNDSHPSLDNSVSTTTVSSNNNNAPASTWTPARPQPQTTTRRNDPDSPKLN